MNNIFGYKGGEVMKDRKLDDIIFDEDGEAVVRQQVIDSYYDGTTDNNKNQNNDNQDDN